MDIWNTYPTLYVRFSNIILNKNIIKIFDIYVSIDGYCSRLIFIHAGKIPHHMLAHLDLNDISINTYRPKQLPTYMVADGEYITHSLI